MYDSIEDIPSMVMVLINDFNLITYAVHTLTIEGHHCMSSISKDYALVLPIVWKTLEQCIEKFQFEKAWVNIQPKPKAVKPISIF